MYQILLTRICSIDHPYRQIESLPQYHAYCVSRLYPTEHNQELKSVQDERTRELQQLEEERRVTEEGLNTKLAQAETGTAAALTKVADLTASVEALLVSILIRVIRGQSDLDVPCKSICSDEPHGELRSNTCLSGPLQQEKQALAIKLEEARNNMGDRTSEAQQYQVGFFFFSF